ncbi:MAG: ABC transporter permease [Deltaproteobacteria bacterium]|nr:ABC transporter permease [Deltaproteobacteria bacterium]
MERLLGLVQPVVTPLGEVVVLTLRALGRWCLFAREVIRWMPRRPRRWHLFFESCEFVGVQSTPIIVLTGVFVGMVFALQTGKAFALFNAENLVGATIGLSLTREIGPVFTALMVVARACSSMAAQIGSMRVTEQIDALETLAVDPIHYLAVPRVVATTIMTPLLTALFNFVGVIGGYMVAVGILQIDEGPLLDRLYHYVDMEDLWGGLCKAACFGFLISVISCYSGYTTRGGAQGVGRATTRAVVISSVTILVVDYFLTAWILEFISPPSM